uniref:Reverse transcriptase domain-containing protein n=1 Tax=Tanacetum cinerariifolium TaxID=118510 RepID=A0A6L2NIU5_TANCI|nr:hypothetical protein [Tanacetum cinerariifolium]
MDKIRRDKRKEVHARLDFEENLRKSRRVRDDSQNSSARTLRYRNPSKRPKIWDRLKYNDEDVFDRLGHRRQSAFDRLINTYSPTKIGPNEGNSRDRSQSRGCSPRRNSSSRDCPRNRNRPRGIEELYSNTRSSYKTGDRDRYHARNRNRSYSKKRGRGANPRYLACRRAALAMGDIGKQSQKGASQQMKKTCPYPRPARIDPKDHLKIFQAAAQVEHWAMPTWCHIFNSALIGAARVWFDELPPESIGGDEETIEEFMEHFKIETERIKGAPECMRISGFMHRVNNPELTKRLNERVPKTVEEMITTTTDFIRGETTVASKKKVHTPWKSQDQSKRHTSEQRSDFRNQPKDG